MTCTLEQTRQGAWVVRDLEAGEVMHPGVGPREEAERLYVQQSRLPQRLRDASGKTFVLFDVGLGAGSNALAAWQASADAPSEAARLTLLSFERDLSALALALAHGERFGFSDPAREAARTLLAQGASTSARTSWHLRYGDLLACLAAETSRADVVFWDPFSAKANPTLWTVAAFSAVRKAAGPRATLFTYSASTTVRMALLLAGWHVGVGAAIGDKAATTAAAVHFPDLEQPLDRVWLSRVERPDVRLPADAGPLAVAAVRACPQFSL